MDQDLVMGMQWYAKQVPRQAGLESGRAGWGWQEQQGPWPRGRGRGERLSPGGALGAVLPGYRERAWRRRRSRLGSRGVLSGGAEMPRTSRGRIPPVVGREVQIWES